MSLLFTDNGIRCSDACYSLSGSANCVEGECVCNLGSRYKYDYRPYYNKQNCARKYKI